MTMPGAIEDQAPPPKSARRRRSCSAEPKAKGGVDPRPFAERVAEAHDLAAILALVSEAAEMVKVCRDVADTKGWKDAAASKLLAERKGGQMLLAGEAAAGLGKTRIARWRNLVKMSDAQFESAVEKSAVPATVEPSPRIKMHISAWTTDELGNQSRTIEAL